MGNILKFSGNRSQTTGSKVVPKAAPVSNVETASLTNLSGMFEISKEKRAQLLLGDLADMPALADGSLDLQNLMTFERLIMEEGMQEVKWICTDGMSPLERHNIRALYSMVSPKKINFQNCDVKHKIAFFEKSIRDMEASPEYRSKAPKIAEQKAMVAELREQQQMSKEIAKRVVG